MKSPRNTANFLNAIAVAVALCVSPICRSEVTTYPIPDEESVYDGFQLQVDGQPVAVYSCRVSAVPLNQWWPGYQRPIEQTELAGFAYWDMTGSVTVEIMTKKPVQQVVIRPQSLGIEAKIEGNKISFDLESPSPIVVEMDGYHNALHLFPNGMSDDSEIEKSTVCCPQCNYCSPMLDRLPEKKDPHFYYFKPGVHDIGTMQLRSNDSVYIAGGAVVYGSFIADDADNIRIWGRGILDGGHIQRGDLRVRAAFGCLHFRNSTNITVDGIILRDPNCWTVNLRGCEQVALSNLKFIGLWRYNADGIDIWNCRDVSMKDCFIRAYDDSVVIRATGENNTDIHIDGCVLWNDWGASTAISARGKVELIENITFKNIDVIRASGRVLEIGHHAKTIIRNIVYENVNVECDDWMPTPKMQEQKGEVYVPNLEKSYLPRLLRVYMDGEGGSVSNVTYHNINIVGNTDPPSSFSGLNSEHAVSNISIENFQHNGKPVTDFKVGHITVGKFVTDIELK